MPFAAIHPEAGRIDATLLDLGCGLSWTMVHKVQPRIALRCPDCGYGVHAKVSARKLRYFAHDPGRPANCAWLNESLEHHLLKLELATRVRDAGWHAELEVRADDGTWRADVLASAHDGARRIAWEAQLSPITDEEIRDRTERYRSEGIEVCWVSPAETVVPWMSKVPSIRVREPRGGDSWAVVDGVAGFDFKNGVWIVVEDLDLTRFIRWVLHEQTAPHQVLPRYRRVWLPSEQGFGRRQLTWTTQRSVGEEARHDAMRQRQEAWRREQEEKKQQAEQIRKEEEARQREAQRLEDERQREIRAEAERVRLEEQQRQRAIEAEQVRQRREAAELQRQEQAAAAERERLLQEQQELQAAQRWWDELSPKQIQQLQEAVAEPLWKEDGARLEFAPDVPTADTAYGIAARLRHRLYGILRPSPASLHRLPPTVRIYVRNAREAQLLIDTGKIDPVRIFAFDLPDHEQMFLI
ncbi:competence protein CoiA family protein [Dactylosporangium sp. NPDC051485]|uniref:competence protein CoiA family protein n=1 Tax=Dactylosporangium sp. NPDC051485 TaxID=3154846 RepID=UPI0034175284